MGNHPTVAAAVGALREGAIDYLHKPCSAEELQAALHRIESAGPAESAVGGKESGEEFQDFQGMLGACAAMREVFALVKRIAPADSTVLVSGESGTGKEMVARAIHQLSRRRDFPLLACDCTALAPTLLESELFGHVKGSFSGAIATKRGLFEVAHQGTLFLDEVANLSLETQGKLLRVLESRRLRKVGDTAEQEVDIRLIATTNRSLAEMVKTGAFRADLYYRLNVVPISLPPLRERPGDVPLLADCFLRHFARQMGMEAEGFSAEAMRQMEVYPWPGNVRELRNIAERISVLYGGLRIERHHLPWEVARCRAHDFHVGSAADLGGLQGTEAADHREPGAAVPHRGHETQFAEHHAGRRGRWYAAAEFPRLAAEPRAKAREVNGSLSPFGRGPGRGGAEPRWGIVSRPCPRNNRGRWGSGDPR